MRMLFAAGCTLKAYKSESVSKMAEFLYKSGVIGGIYDMCCKSNPGIEEAARIIDCCPGCRSVFEAIPNASVVSLWRVLIHTDFPLPNYHGRKMTIHDACHARGRNSSEIQDAARELCKKMNIKLVEPSRTRDEAPCCGGCAKNKEARIQMAYRRAGSLPCEDVVLYCTGCVRSFSVTDVRPRHLFDLIFSEQTEGLTLL